VPIRPVRVEILGKRSPGRILILAHYALVADEHKGFNETEAEQTP